MPTELMHVDEVAAFLKVSAVTVRRWRKEGRIPPPVPLPISPQYWRRSDIEALNASTSADVGGLKDGRAVD